MKRRLLPWLDVSLLLGALAVIGALLSWWNVFSRRLIGENLALQQAAASDEAGRLAAVAKSERLGVMIAGESAVLVGLLTVLVLGLWALGRQRRRQALQTVKLLQFTGHEFKTPVAGIKALLEALKAGRVPEASKGTLLEHGLSACDALEHLTDSMLVLQRSRAFDPRALAQEDAVGLVLSVVEHRRTAHLGEEVVVAELAPCAVRADRDAVRVVLENLFDNARKYGGAKTVIRSTTEKGRCRISISDAGRGFSQADAESLFEPLRPQPHQGVTHGSGLGLHLSRQLARHMGGELTAESKGPGTGATFHFDLECVEGARA
jgi:signal transduction histidine kinase